MPETTSDNGEPAPSRKTRRNLTLTNETSEWLDSEADRLGLQPGQVVDFLVRKARGIE